MTIGERIKQKRIELGMSQEELAKEMGYKTRNAIYQFEQKDNMKLSLVEKFAKALHTTPAYLMGWEDENGETTLHGQLVDIYVQNAQDQNLLELYHNVPPEVRSMVDYLLRSSQPSSEVPHLKNDKDE